MTLTSFMLDWAMGGRPDNFLPFHCTSLILHLGSTVLLILLCYQLFGNPWIAAITGLLFGVHPLTVEPIAWVMERKTVLAAFFAFAALCAYVRYTKSRRPAVWFAAALLFYLLSLLSKPTSTPLPLILLLLDYWPLRRLSKRAFLEKIPFFILAGLFAILTMLCEQRVNPLSLPATLSPLHLPLRLCYLAAFYLAKLALPINLSSVYMLPKPLALTNPIIIAAVAGTIVLIITLVISRRYTPALWVGVLIFYLGLAPTMGFVGYSWVSASDKYVYLPGVGLVLILAWLLNWAWTTRLRRRVAIAAVALAAVLLSLDTRQYLHKWQSSESLFQYMIRLAPNSPNLHCQRGAMYLDQLNYKQAVQEYSAAIALFPTCQEAYHNRGVAYHGLHDYDNALRDLTKAAELIPIDPEPYYNRGLTYIAMGKYRKAINDYTKAIRLSPKSIKLYNNRATAYIYLKQYSQAEQDCTKAIEIQPTFAFGFHNRAVARYYMNRLDQARGDLAQCIRLGGKPHPDLVAKLGPTTSSAPWPGQRMNH